MVFFSYILFVLNLLYSTKGTVGPDYIPLKEEKGTSLNALLNRKGVTAVLPTGSDEILLYRALLVVPVFCQSYWFFDVICLN